MIESVALDLLRGGLITLQIAAGAWVVAVVLGLALAVARDAGGLALGIPLIGVLTGMRSVPQLVILYVLFFGISSLGLQVDSLVAAILGLGLTEAAFTAEYYRAGFMTVPWNQRDAGASLGLSRLGVLRHVVIPQATPYVVAPLLNSFVGLLKTATLAAAVGAPEILYRGQNEMNVTGLIVVVVLMIIGMYAVVTIPLTRAVASLDRRIRAYAGVG
jgi:His/Glu/Gln/Arg/opine family amino acid ABC transporter permease subunit